MTGLLVIIIYLLKRVPQPHTTAQTWTWSSGVAGLAVPLPQPHGALVSCALLGGRGMGWVALLSGFTEHGRRPTGMVANGPIQLCFFENRYDTVEFKSRSRTVWTLGQTV